MAVSKARLMARMVLWTFICGCALDALMVSPAWAYVDPSVMTYTIQALAGVAVALSAVAGVAFRRGRKALFSLLGIDEDARKQRESDVHRLVAGRPVSEGGIDNAPSDGACGPEENPSAMRRTGLKAPVANGGPLPDLGWRKRFGIALAVTLFAAVTLCILAPLEIVAASSGSLVYAPRDVAALMIGAGLFVAAVAAFALSALRGRAFGLVTLLVFAVAFGAYIQALFLNVGLPPADGKAVNWGAHAPIAVASTAMWIAALALVMGFGHVRPQRTLGAAAVVSCALVIVQAVGTASLLVAPPETAAHGEGDGLHAHVAAAGSPQPTEDGLFEVSPSSNIIVFVLDTFDTDQLKRLVGDDPSLLGEFTGFTWFQNVSGSMIPTRYAIPCLLTGQVPREGESFMAYLSERYLRSTFLQDLHACDFTIGLYSDSLNLEYLSGADAADITELTVNLHPAATSSMDALGTWLALMKCSLYRDAPWPLKPPFWFYTDEINLAMVAYDPAGDPADTVYLMDDPQYYERLQRFGLAATDDRGRGAFRFIHLIGPHQPYSMDEHAHDVGLDNSDIDAQAIGSLRIVDDYLHRLKDAGLYESATVIVTADHGTWFSTLDPLETPSVPIMLVKPAQESEAARRPIEISHAAVSHFDMQATIIDAAGGNAQPYGPTMFDVAVDDETRERAYYATTNDGWHDQEIVEYAIDGDPLDTANWHETGNRWTAQE